MKTVAILGAGAIGSYFIYCLTEKLGDDLCVVAAGDRAQRLRNEGININGVNYIPNVKTTEEAKGVDLLLVSVKYGALEGCMDDIAEIVDEHTVVLSLLNGVDSEDIIGRRIGYSHMLYSIMKITSERRGNNIVFNPETTPGLFFGELRISEPTKRVQEVMKLFENTQLHYRFIPDILREIWYKFALNVSQNQPQAILNIGFGGYADSEHMGFLRSAFRAEVTAIAAAKGIDISKPQGIEGKSSPTAKRGRYSTLQDLDAGRHTEVDAFAGTVVRMGREMGIPTPYNEFAYHAIKALEEKNDGLFDYE
ncbi:MAG: 2-dehydropantoate 2-reductase [Parasporobacterium sp.]|nr:2-dehydropantoate 2-reductase [Parasporobacterium sp.]